MALWWQEGCSNLQDITLATVTVTQATVPSLILLTEKKQKFGSYQSCNGFSSSKLKSLSWFTPIGDQNNPHPQHIVNKKKLIAWPKIKVPKPLGASQSLFLQIITCWAYISHLDSFIPSNYKIKRNMLKSVTMQSKFNFWKCKAWSSYRKRTQTLLSDSSHPMFNDLSGKEYDLHSVKLAA